MESAALHDVIIIIGKAIARLNKPIRIILFTDKTITPFIQKTSCRISWFSSNNPMAQSDSDIVSVQQTDAKKDGYGNMCASPGYAYLAANI